MAMAMALCNTHQRLSAVNPDGVNSFLEKLLLQIYDHFDDQELVDVTFKLSNPTASVTAHRLILSAASPYFRELFKSEKGFCPLIEITEIDSDTFERLVSFCYTGKTLITLENVDEMLKGAIFLQLHDAVVNCADFIIDNISDYTLRRACVLESETHNDILSKKIVEYGIKHFREFIQSIEFLNFDANKLQTILESDDLNVHCEKDVFEAVKLWYEHDPSARKQQLPDLVGRLRLTQFDANYITTNINPLPGCYVLALEALAWINTPLSRSVLKLKYTKPRERQSEFAEEFLALNIEYNNGNIYQYNKTQNSWEKWYNLTTDIAEFRVIFFNGNLIFIGGRRNITAINEVSSWNFKTKTFKQLPSMKQPRYRHSVVLLNDKIYAIGGCDSKKALQSVEMYSVSNGWQTINGMITARSSAAAVTLNGKIYVMGGWNRGQLKSVERYDPETGCWTKCADMNEEHNYPGATVHKEQIFVVGGYNDRGENKTVERYDLQRNEWSKICSLSTGSWGLECISIYNQLWAIGGGSEDCVSVYDDQNDEWMDKSPIPSKGSFGINYNMGLLPNGADTKMGVFYCNSVKVKRSIEAGRPPTKHLH